MDDMVIDLESDLDEENRCVLEAKGEERLAGWSKVCKRRSNLKLVYMPKGGTVLVTIIIRSVLVQTQSFLSFGRGKLEGNNKWTSAHVVNEEE